MVEEGREKRVQMRKLANETVFYPILGAAQ